MGTDEERMKRGVVLWFTGLPGSGKTTISRGVEEKLREDGVKVERLDGDWARRTVSIGAGFTRDERRRHLIRIAWIARLLSRNGITVLCSFVSPYRDVREEVRKIIEEEAEFYEIYVRCSLKEVMRRDPKGLYAKALRGEIKHMTGLDDPYEAPERPDLILDTEREKLEQNVEKVLELLREDGWVM